MPSIRWPSATETLNGIAKIFDDYGDNLPRHDDLPGKIREVLKILDSIEKIVRKPNSNRRLYRDELVENVDRVVGDRNLYRNAINDVAKQVSRVTNTNPRKLPLKDIVLQTEEIVHVVEAIKPLVRAKELEPIHFDQIHFDAENVRDKYNTYSQNRSFLLSIARIVHPSDHAQNHDEDMLSKLAASVGNLDLNHGAPRANPESSPDVLTEKNISHEAKLGELEGEVKKLIGENKHLLQRNGVLEHEAKESKSLLESAKQEAALYKATSGRYFDEIEKLQESQRKTRESHAQSIADLNTERASAIAEIERLKACELGLRDNHERSLKSLAAEKESAMVEIERLNTFERDLRESHKQSMNGLAAEKASAMKKIECQEEEAKRLVAKYEENLEEQRKRYRSTVWKHGKDLTAQKEANDAEKREREGQHQLEKAALQRQIDDLGLKHATELRTKKNQAIRAGEEWAKKSDDDLKQHKLELDRLETQHSTKLSRQGELHALAMEAAADSKRKELIALQGKHEDQIMIEKQQVTEVENMWKLKLTKVTETHQQEHAALSKALDTAQTDCGNRLGAQAQKHKNETAKLQRLVTNLQDVLLKHAPPGLTDLEILQGVTAKGGKTSIVGYTNIVSRVTTFAEWDWREDRKVWPNDLLTSLVGTKQRLLRKLILGDVIWSCLFQLIFCSPFRILGKEGESLEEDWRRQFSSGDDISGSEYVWPTADALSEKYRWETCEAAFDSLTKPSSPYSPLRFSYVNHQAQFNEQFLETVEAYVELTEKREQDLVKFLTQAVRMWLVFCSQRYRISMVLPGSSLSHPNEKMELVQGQEDVIFTIAPRLQRHGDPKGKQLEEMSVISGCDGKMASIREFLS